MGLKKVATVLGCTESYSEKLHNCTIRINSVVPNFKIDNSTWYYVIAKDMTFFAYNSNLDQIMFESKEECKIAAENKMKELIELNFPNKEDNVHYSTRCRC